MGRQCLSDAALGGCLGDKETPLMDSFPFLFLSLVVSVGPAWGCDTTCAAQLLRREAVLGMSHSFG